MASVKLFAHRTTVWCGAASKLCMRMLLQKIASLSTSPDQKVQLLARHTAEHTCQSPTSSAFAHICSKIGPFAGAFAEGRRVPATVRRRHGLSGKRKQPSNQRTSAVRSQQKSLLRTVRLASYWRCSLRARQASEWR